MHGRTRHVATPPLFLERLSNLNRICSTGITYVARHVGACHED
jgi:hypothetical protein